METGWCTAATTAGCKTGLSRLEVYGQDLFRIMHSYVSLHYNDNQSIINEN